MVFLRISVVFLVAVLQWQADCNVLPTSAVPQCPPDQHYGIIGGCDLTCDSVDLGTICLPYAYRGCRCNDGLIPQSGTDECVKPEDCNAKCGPNKHYEPCGSNCQPKCGNPDVPSDCGCSPRCVCDEGYILSGFDCVKKTDCPTDSNSN
ncbi:zonadhesin-like isoform X1 [Bufo bufo]|uniref:zonadhesin-like isoform X1 n=1 Tax=Bufo bufo TaxID=8384 RepID=UPI001ABDB5C9|nr:zonadhesin-like isoform X1 [Bufo bufo]